MFNCFFLPSGTSLILADCIRLNGFDVEVDVFEFDIFLLLVLLLKDGGTSTVSILLFCVIVFFSIIIGGVVGSVLTGCC
jgi:hypothetical protein